MSETFGLGPSASTFGVSERRALLVGRAGEMHDLDDAYRAVRDKGRSRAVTVIGAAGIGKTRLVADFLGKLRALGDRAPRVFRGSARENEPAFAVFARVLRARFGIGDNTEPEAAGQQVRAACASVLEDRKVGDVVYFLGQILGLSFQESPLTRAVEGDPAEVAAVRRAVLKHFFEADAASHRLPQLSGGDGADKAKEQTVPLVLVFDDLHHAHDASLDLLAYLMGHLTGPVLMVTMARPELLARRESWFKHGDVHKHIELPPLSETEAAAAMQDLLTPCGDSPVVDDLIENACTFAAGNPALLEQIVRVFLDMGVLEVVRADAGSGDEETWRVHPEKLDGVRMPMSVGDAVQARIAALSPPERELLERAAVMGGVFWLGGLLTIYRLDQPAPEVWPAGNTPDIARLREGLRELTERDYLLRLPDSSFAGDEEYVFKHNLERELLVKITPPASARRYHGAIASWLSFKEHVRTHEEYMAMLARHHEAAGDRSHAATAFLAAADIARSRYANGKALEFYATGLGLLQQAGVEVDVDQRLNALHHYGDVLQSLGRNDDALHAFREMLVRAYRVDQRAKGGAAHSRIGRLYRETGRLDEASQHLAAALALFEESRDDRGIASTVDDIGKLHWLRGDYQRALEFTQRALSMRRRIGDRRSIALSLNNLGLVYQDSGQFQQALETFEQALQIRREIGDLVGVTISLNNLGTVAQDQRDDSRALALFQEAYEVARETGDRNRIALVLTNLGETYNRLGDADQAIFFLKQAEELADELGDQNGLAEAARGLGKAHLARREHTKAREYTQRAVEIFTEIQSRMQLGVALRSLGEVTAAASAGGEGLKSARGYLVKSVHIFEELGNDVELARSCRAYADMLRATSEYQNDPNVIREASSYSKRADEIFAKLKIGSGPETSLATLAGSAGHH